MAGGSRAAAWTDWSTAAFGRALASARPVALLVEARWSAACDRCHREVVAAPQVADVLAARFEAIRVDADERPDLAERYTGAGWPTLVALTPHGWPLAPIPTADPGACAGRLAAVASAFDADRATLLRHVARSDEGAHRARSWLAPLSIVAAWLDEWEGPGGDRLAAAHPRALAAAIEWAAANGQADLAVRAVSVLDGLGASPLRDPGSGLWFRAAPHAPTGIEPAQVLDEQAAWATAEVAARLAHPSPTKHDRLAALVRGVERGFAGPHGDVASRFSLEAGAERDPAVFGDTCQRDERVLVDAQARMLSALLRAGGACGVSAWSVRAIDRLDALVATAYQRDGGVAHVLDRRPRIRGLLGDQVAVASALLDAWEVSGRVAYLDASDELLQSTLRKFLDRAAGLLRDRVPTTAGAGDVGLLGPALYPPDANVTAARCLARLAASRGDATRREAGQAIAAACLARADPADPAHPELLSILA